MQIIFGLIEDIGDGSSTIRWFRNPEIVDMLLEDSENFYANDGHPKRFQFPDYLNLEECGFDFSDDWHLESLYLLQNKNNENEDE